MGRNMTAVTPMPGRGLHVTCLAVMVLCGVHLAVTLFYYLDVHVYTGQMMRRFGNFMESERLSIPANSTGPSSAGPTRTGSSTAVSSPPPLQPCPETSPLLVGPLEIGFSQSVNLEDVQKINPLVREGGRFAPVECTALQKVAIIIPFRNRLQHLNYWLYYLHPILQRQQLDYGVYVINQHGEDTFNRAKLLNVGFMEALKVYDYSCFVFSDVDLIPMDDRNIYKCYSQPRHLAVSMDKFGFRLPYNQYFGGISALSKEQHEKINGFPNDYWGWGGEDDDIYNRIVFKGMSISRPSGGIGKCRMIRHNRDQNNAPNPQRFNRISQTRQTMQHDGLNSLVYKVLEVKKYPLYTFIDVDIGGPGRPPSR
ncbi:beta-1,4-galactosyltransferase 1-like isoform X2 [Carcharodon carcharias]|uniref:beta-1,4-galactosyltransferase 1-like isoform X2 n=1 Tax=Carcharodon carcharias TaxID=13397 RepID=UPI001B7DA7D9|nr:beta-1,4-galactosyltransferase 1-like isoform X2 [Carcharodon carcharias]